MVTEVVTVPDVGDRLVMTGALASPTLKKVDGLLSLLYSVAIQSAERDTPDYIEVDTKGLSVKFVRAPDLAEVPYAVKMEPNLVVEFYAS